MNQLKEEKHMPDNQDFYKLKNSYDVLLAKLEATVGKLSHFAKVYEEKSEEVSVTTTKFIVHFEEFKKLERAARVELAKTIAESAGDLTKVVAKALETSVEQSADTLNRKLKSALQETVQWEKGYYRRKLLINLAFCGACLLTALGSSYFFAWKIEQHYASQLIQSAQWGELIQRAWPKLTKKEQDRIKYLSFGGH
jgi:hypothetical protein